MGRAPELLEHRLRHDHRVTVRLALAHPLLERRPLRLARADVLEARRGAELEGGDELVALLEIGLGHRAVGGRLGNLAELRPEAVAVRGLEPARVLGALALRLDGGPVESAVEQVRLILGRP